MSRCILSSSFWTMSNFFLQTIVIYLLDLIFLQRTKMEAVVYGDQTMRFDLLLRVENVMTSWELASRLLMLAHLSYIFRLCADYFVVLSPQSMANAPPRELWIYQCPHTFMEFEDVYAQVEYFFARIPHTPIFLKYIVNCSCFYSINNYRLCL